MYYDSVISENPYNHLVHFNKGISLYRQMRYDEAMPFFQKCILLNPYYSSAHYHLGVIAMRQGNLFPAILSFPTNLFASPENKYYKYTICML